MYTPSTLKKGKKAVMYKLSPIFNSQKDGAVEMQGESFGKYQITINFSF